MKVGLYYPGGLPLSLRHYTDNVVRELKGLGVDFIPYTDKDPLPDKADLLWDPRCGRGAPANRYITADKPVVVTFHGAAHLVLPLRECFDHKIMALLRGIRSRRRTRIGWGALRDSLAGVIAVSEYAGKEFEEHLGITGGKVFAVHHGVDHGMFYTGDGPQGKGRFILHISSYQPKKNIDRIIAAYSAIRLADKPRLLLVAPRFPKRRVGKGIEIIRAAMTHEQLRPLYQEALCFVFPSLHETFGMPILEAMACGCPVITSNVTACPEVAGDASLLVDPRNKKDIYEAMRKMIADGELRQALRAKGLERARSFTWGKSAEEHIRIFELILGNSR